MRTKRNTRQARLPGPLYDSVSVIMSMQPGFITGFIERAVAIELRRVCKAMSPKGRQLVLSIARHRGVDLGEYMP